MGQVNRTPSSDAFSFLDTTLVNASLLGFSAKRGCDADLLHTSSGEWRMEQLLLHSEGRHRSPTQSLGVAFAFLAANGQRRPLRDVLCAAAHSG